MKLPNGGALKLKCICLKCDFVVDKEDVMECPRCGSTAIEWLKEDPEDRILEEVCGKKKPH